MLVPANGQPLIPLTDASDIPPAMVEYEERQRSRLVAMTLARRKLRCMIGSILAEYRDTRLYYAAGETSFESFIQNSGIDLSPRQAWRYIEYYRNSLRLTQALPDEPAAATPEQVDRIGPAKLAIVSPVLQNAHTPEERQYWLQEAQQQPMAALEMNVREAMGEQFTLRQEFLHQQAMAIRGLASQLEQAGADVDDVIRQLRAKVDTLQATLLGMPSR